MRQFCRAAVSSARCTIPVKEGMRMAERMPMTASTMVSSKSVNPAFAPLLRGSLRVRIASLTILIFIQYNTANGKLQSPRRHFSTKSDIYFPSSDNNGAPWEPLFRFCLCIKRYAPVCSWNNGARQKTALPFHYQLKRRRCAAGKAAVEPQAVQRDGSAPPRFLAVNFAFSRFAFAIRPFCSFPPPLPEKSLLRNSFSCPVVLCFPCCFYCLFRGMRLTAVPNIFMFIKTIKKTYKY